VSTTLSQIDLDVMVANGCQTPGCTHRHENHKNIFLTGRCHPHQGASAEYVRGGLLHLRCHVCSRPIATIAVAKLFTAEGKVPAFLEGAQ
jgi:hypothetical protein